MYCGVPATSAPFVSRGRQLACEIPKSSTFTKSFTPSPDSSMTLSGLRSRWTIPRTCAACSACAICSTMPTAAAGVSSPGIVDPLGQRLPFEHLHHQVGVSLIRDVEVEHLHDVRVAQRRGDLRFLAEARQHLRVLLQAAVKDLDRDLPGKARVIGQEDLSASTFRDRADDSIRPLEDRSRREFGERDVSFGVHLAGCAGAAAVPCGVAGALGGRLAAPANVSKSEASAGESPVFVTSAVSNG